MVYKDNVIEGLKDLASYDYQKIAWFKNDLALWSDLEEDAEWTFFGSGLSATIKDGDIVFGKEADKALLELEAACDAVPYERDDTVFVHSPEMAIIREMAKRCLKLVRESDGSESTAEITNSGAPVCTISFPDRDVL